MGKKNMFLKRFSARAGHLSVLKKGFKLILENKNKRLYKVADWVGKEADWEACRNIKGVAWFKEGHN